MEDRDIVELYWQRSERAIAETAEKYGRYCYAIAYSALDSAEDARECVNDTWLAAWNAMPDARPKALGAFLGRITRRTAIDRWRARAAARRGGGELPLALEELAECVPAAEDVEARLEAAELSRAVDAFVRTLPAAERAVFLSRYWYMDPVKDIAARLGSTQSRVKSMLARTRARLRTYLEREGLL